MTFVLQAFPFFTKKIQLTSTSLLSLLIVVFALNCNLSYAATNEYIDYQKVLLEERAWAGLQSKSLRVGDITWSYSEGGDSSKPTILLIHGLASSRDTWNDVAYRLTPYYHIIIPDLPGSGSTQTPEFFDNSVPNVTEQLRRFIEAAHLQNNLNIAGHSLGGAIAMFYASQYPFDTKSLYLISTGGIFKSNSTNYLKSPMYLKQLLINQPGDLDFVQKKVMYKPPFTPSLIKQEQERLFIARSQETSKIINQITELNKLYTPTSFASMLKNIEAPTKILWGKQDQIINVEVAYDLKSLLKHAEEPVILNHVGHMPLLESPEQVADQYHLFLDKIQTQKNLLSEHKIYK